MENYVKAAEVHFRYHMKYHLLAAVLLFCLMPFLVGVQYLGARETAQTLEMYVALMGIVFLVPVFMPDQDKNIRELLRSKKLSYTGIHILRIGEGLLLLLLFVGAAVWFLKMNACVFPAGIYFLGTLAEAVFLGGAGMLIYSLTDQAAVGYMIPMVYYLINLGGDKYVKNFYLFSMMKGSYEPKLWLAAAGLLCLAGGVWWRRLRP